MAFYIVQPDPGTGASLPTTEGGVEAYVVNADSVTSARQIVKASGQFPSDASVDAATVTLLADPADLAGFRLRVYVYNPTTLATVTDVTVTGVTVADKDTLAALAVIALNAAGPMAAAAYADPTLTIAAAGDTLGDMACVVQLLPPATVNDPTVPIPAGVGAITDEGAAGAALTVVLNDIVTPAILGSGKISV